MADEQPPERDINIQSHINVGTASGQTNVSGLKVSVGSAREVHVQGDTTLPPSFRSVALVSTLAFLGAILINIATSQLPDSWKPYLWLSWPLALLVMIASAWLAYRQSRSSAASITIGSSSRERNRTRMLDKMENFWIKGVLEQSLYQIARLELGLEQVPQRVTPLWPTVFQQASTRRAIATGTSVIKLFDDLDGKLLILGAPGAGKTTMLLELARDLIARARSDPHHPIPLVFDLSTWASHQKPLRDWLAGELHQRYDVPPKLAKAWVVGDEILPLLDGLDEVALAQRDACVEAINTYRQEHGLAQVAVCSRIEEYAELVGKLKLQGAVLIQPLTQQTIETYLRQVEHPLAAVRAALLDDPTLWELLDSPLMLSIVALAYKDKIPTKLRALETIEGRRRQLFDDYIAAMFARRGNAIRYAQQQTIRWLSWVASQMTRYKLTVFHINSIKYEWLPLKQERQGHHLFILRIILFLVLIGVLGAALGSTLGSTLSSTPGDWLLIWLLIWLLVGLVICLIFLSANGLHLWWLIVLGGVSGGVLGGVLGGLPGLLGGVLGGMLGGGLLIGLRLALLVGLGRGLRDGLLRWLSDGLSNVAFIGLGWGHCVLLGGLSGVLVGWLGSVLVGWLERALGEGAQGGPFVGFLVGLFVGLPIIEGLILGTEVGQQEVFPDVGLGVDRLAWLLGLLGGGALIGLSLGLPVGLGVGLLVVLFCVQLFWINLGLPPRMRSVRVLLGALGGVLGGMLDVGLLGVLGGTLAGVFVGVLPVSDLYILSWLLYRSGSLPFRIVPFFDYCVEMLFLRKVGDEYIFVHRLLMEHFASLYTEQPAASPSDGAAD